MAVDPFDIPLLARQEWMSYRWVRKTINGEIDVLSVEGAKRKGWEPVRRSEQSNVAGAKLWDRDSEFAEYGGLILMKRPDHLTMKALSEERKKSYELLHEASASIEVSCVPLTDNMSPPQPKWRRIVNIIMDRE